MQARGVTGGDAQAATSSDQFRDFFKRAGRIRIADALSLAPDVQVVAPDELRQQVLAQAQQIVTLYQQKIAG